MVTAQHIYSACVCRAMYAMLMVLVKFLIICQCVCVRDRSVGGGNGIALVGWF